MHLAARLSLISLPLSLSRQKRPQTISYFNDRRPFPERSKRKVETDRKKTRRGRKKEEGTRETSNENDSRYKKENDEEDRRAQDRATT